MELPVLLHLLGSSFRPSFNKFRMSGKNYRQMQQNRMAGYRGQRFSRKTAER